MMLSGSINCELLGTELFSEKKQRQSHTHAQSNRQELSAGGSEFRWEINRQEGQRPSSALQQECGARQASIGTASAGVAGAGAVMPQPPPQHSGTGLYRKSERFKTAIRHGGLVA